MKKAAILLLTVCCMAMLLYGCSDGQAEPSVTAEASYTQIGTDEAVDLMETEKDYVILDVRTQEEFESGHIPGAICIPNETIGEEEPSGLPDKDQLILVYCRSGRRSKEAAQKLADLGYTNITEFGGIIDWSGETVTGS